MLNDKEKDAVKNYYLESYINTIRYILTFDDNVNSKYDIYIENKPSNDGFSYLLIRITSKKIANIDNKLLLNNEISGYVPMEIGNEIINAIRNHFAENHYIVYSSVNKMYGVQTLQNERFSVNIKLNNDDEINEAQKFNSNINSNERHATKVLKLV